MRAIRFDTLKCSLAEAGNISAFGSVSRQRSTISSSCSLFLTRSILLMTSSTGTFSLATLPRNSAFFIGSSTTSVTYSSTSASVRALWLKSSMLSWSLYLGLSTPGVSLNTIWYSGVFTMPIMRWRVVCAFEVMMLTRSPTRSFMSVDLPTLGLPTMFTNPDLCFSVICLKFGCL